MSTLLPDRPLRIALLTYRGKPTCGGQGVYVRHLSRELAALGHRVDVFSGPPYPVVDPGVRLHPLPGLDLFADPHPFRRPAPHELRRPADWAEYLSMRRGGFGEPLAFSLRALGHLRRHRAAYDVVHDNQGLGYGLLGLPVLGLPALATIHHPVAIDHQLEARDADATRAGQLRRWYRFVHMQRRVARRMPAVLTVSEASKQAIIAHMHVSPAAIDVVPAGVDHRVFHTDPTVHRVPGRIVTTASADVPLKGLADLLHALVILRVQRPVHLVVIGAPRLQSPTRDLIRELGIHDAVTFRNDLSDTALADLLRSAEVACVPSRFEGFSLPAVEAMACGTPLVTTTAGALPEVTGPAGEAALHVPPDDPNAMADALGRLLADPGLRDRLAHGATRRAARFTWRATAAATVTAYQRILTGTPSTPDGAATRC